MSKRGKTLIRLLIFPLHVLAVALGIEEFKVDAIRER